MNVLKLMLLLADVFLPVQEEEGLGLLVNKVVLA